MKSRIEELDVDFISGQEPMTKEEELTISGFIRANKEKSTQQELQKSKTKTSLKNKQTA